MKILLVAGARPNFMKIAPLIHELRSGQWSINWKVVHTGQHYDYEMSKVFFDDFDIPEPDYFLNVGSGTHAEQCAKAMVEFEKVCFKEAPDIVVVVGDVNSTLACSVTAKKLNIKVAHVEAGLRSGDLTMPEEINRIVTDSITDYLFVTEKDAVKNLEREGKGDNQIFFVGNIMVDALHYSMKKLGVSQKGNGKGKDKENTSSGYAVVTLHRPSNVDHRAKLKGILEVLVDISKDMKIYFPMHPRTKKNIENFGFDYLVSSSNISVLSPMSYLKFLALWKNAALVLTDSGGIQEETTAVGVPCFTLRENTERPITLEEGTNILVGTSRDKILEIYDSFKKGGMKIEGKCPKLWDGRAAERIIKQLATI